MTKLSVLARKNNNNKSNQTNKPPKTKTTTKKQQTQRHAAEEGPLTCFGITPPQRSTPPHCECDCCLSIFFLAWYRLTASLFSRLVFSWRSGSCFTFSQCRRLLMLWRCLALSWCPGKYGLAECQRPSVEMGSLPGGALAPAPARQHKTGSAQVTI